MNAIGIFAIPAFTDNYIWTVQNSSGHCLVVDPGDADAVREALADRGLRLSAILITHHHMDHVGGVKSLREEWGVPVYGPDNPAIFGIDHCLGDGDTLSLDEFDLPFQILAVPGHTLDHIAYYSAEHKLLFCGDTLFHAGCGRLFEGSPAQMLASLDRLAALPGDTAVYCTHEYTLANLRFARAVEPNNAALQIVQQQAQAQRDAGKITLPSDIATQKAINPFLRCDEATVQAAARRREPDAQARQDVFAAIRQWKDQF